MPFSYLPPLLASVFAGLAHWLQKRSAARLPQQLEVAWRDGPDRNRDAVACFRRGR